MNFRIDKHDEGDVYWLVQDIYHGLINSTYLNQKSGYGWSINYESPFAQPSLMFPERVDIYVESIKRGDISDPIVMNINGEIIDGRHKSHAYNIVGFQMPVARPVLNNKIEIVNDNVYKPLLVKKYEHFPGRRLEIDCINCIIPMELNRKKYLVCPLCNYNILYRQLMGWTVINK